VRRKTIELPRPGNRRFPAAPALQIGGGGRTFIGDGINHALTKQENARRLKLELLVIDNRMFTESQQKETKLFLRERMTRFDHRRARFEKTRAPDSGLATGRDLITFWAAVRTG
jgi:hypothetical protein